MHLEEDFFKGFKDFNCNCKTDKEKVHELIFGDWIPLFQIAKKTKVSYASLYRLKSCDGYIDRSREKTIHTIAKCYDELIDTLKTKVGEMNE